MTIDKDQYYPGEDMIIRVNCNNSKCKKPVIEFKAMLRRRILVLGYKGKYYKQSKWVADRLVTGCDAKTEKQFSLTLQIPTESPFKE